VAAHPARERWLTAVDGSRDLLARPGAEEEEPETEHRPGRRLGNHEELRSSEGRIQERGVIRIDRVPSAVVDPEAIEAGHEQAR